LVLAANPASALQAATKQYVDTAGGGVTVSDTPPAGPTNGKLWFDSVSSNLFVRYDDGSSQQWVVAVNFNTPDFSHYVLDTGDTMTGSLVMVDPISVVDPAGYAKYMFYDVPGGVLRAQIYFDATNNSLNFNNIVAGTNFALPGAGGGFSLNQYLVGTDSITIKGVNTVNPTFVLANNPGTAIGQFYADLSNNNVHMSNAQSGGDLYIDNGANMLYNSAAYKPGGGPWSVSSDVRIKNVIGWYEPGLAEVVQLEPIIYTYRGNDTPSAEGVSVHKMAAEANTPYVGLIAQEVEKIFPGMVTEHAGFIDGKPTQIKDIDSGPLIYALVNAVKELSARIAVLEGGK
jgi:hypothetical protein